MMDDPEYLKTAFDAAQSQHAEKLNFSPNEADKFKKAFDDPEFRKMFAGTSPLSNEVTPLTWRLIQHLLPS